nr:hypothetical protein Q903MT_gene5886 [Picea sitchensis]
MKMDLKVCVRRVACPLHPSLHRHMALPLEPRRSPKNLSEIRIVVY